MGVMGVMASYVTLIATQTVTWYCNNHASCRVRVMLVIHVSSTMSFWVRKKNNLNISCYFFSTFSLRYHYHSRFEEKDLFLVFLFTNIRKRLPLLIFRLQVLLQKNWFLLHFRLEEKLLFLIFSFKITRRWLLLFIFHLRLQEKVIISHFSFTIRRKYYYSSFFIFL